MKLNLLPTSATKGKGVVRAWVFSGILSVAAIAASIWMIVTSTKALNDAKDAALEEKSHAEMVTSVASQADDLIKLAEPYQRNTNLVIAMDKNVPKYPNFYNDLRKKIPGFFRITSLVATPVSEAAVAVTMTGIIKDQEQYNDLVLALLRIPAQGVQRQVISHDDIILPNILPNDLKPEPYKTSEGRIPSQPDDKLNYFIAKGGVTGYVNANGFGDDEMGRRGAMPKYNEIQVAFTVPGNLQAPNVRGTLALHGSAPAPAPAPGATPASAPKPATGGGGAAGAAGNGGGD